MLLATAMVVSLLTGCGSKKQQCGGYNKEETQTRSNCRGNN